MFFWNLIICFFEVLAQCLNAISSYAGPDCSKKIFCPENKKNMPKFVKNYGHYFFLKVYIIYRHVIFPVFTEIVWGFFFFFFFKL